MLRFNTQSQKNTLFDWINLLKHQEGALALVIEDLAVKLLDEMRPLDNEVDNACQMLYSLISNDPAFVTILGNILNNKSIHQDIKNCDDVKYQLRKWKYYQEFIHGADEKFKKEHCAIIAKIVKKTINVDLNHLINNNLEEINKLRTKLIHAKSTGSKDENRINLALLILAKYWPLNAEDPISLEAINFRDRIFVTTGHQFDINYLLEFYETKTQNNGTNLITNLKFSVFDTKHLEAVVTPSKLEVSSYTEEYLYDFNVIDIIDELRSKLKACDLAFHEINLKRIAHLDAAKRDVLVHNIQKHHSTTNWFGGEIEVNEFSSNLNALLIRGLSIERFASFDADKQEALTLSNPSVYYLIDQGFDSDKLFELSATHLLGLCQWIINEPNSLMNLYLKSPNTIRTINEQIDELLASQRASQKMEMKV